MISRDELERLWSDTGPLSGWDFSRLNVRRAPVPWNYDDVIFDSFSSADDVLDVGTGGGERLLGFVGSFKSAVGIDFDPAMIATANRNARENGVENIEFQVASAADTGQLSSAFDGVINRHSVIDISEIARVLKPGGRFVSQQVGDRNLANLLKPFGGQDFDGYRSPEVIRSQFENRGFSILRLQEYEAEYRFLDIESVLFQIKAIGGYLMTPPTLDSISEMLEATSDDQGGCVSSEHRYLIVAEKN